ncbi:hypothetical protein S7711_05409 [Stachybotrys chartarum IBT 7711]|uniref:CRAL-TRIO domain-containing protein n=1 Tax=Stachybotrys chartarum (strain CBS 109288 / IBT 7711) TaxID=1280523 RepID=A0A084AHI0_STACB|nr:hypothetical protein S7711_05409 [Stachybotrys chartarum IBT 7711]KFA45427.1 hypothetical protein S40293_09997 [Stachybotrys chartarum IBT 40293]KFA79136.1 hypothetical protein S40288_05702 [Stachybotrys chartarum IBT 40288]
MDNIGTGKAQWAGCSREPHIVQLSLGFGGPSLQPEAALRYPQLGANGLNPDPRASRMRPATPPPSGFRAAGPWIDLPLLGIRSFCRLSHTLVSRRRPSYSTPAHAQLHLRSSVAQTVLFLGVLAASAVAVWAFAGAESPPSQDHIQSLIDAMSVETLPGRPGNLTPEQEEKVRQLWQNIFQLCGVSDAATPPSTATTTASDKTESDAPGKKKRFNLFRKKGDKAAPAEPKTDDEDKYGQTKQFYDTLATQSPESIRATIWDMVKHDNPDALVLRFLRARKWDVDAALVMFVSTMNWRHVEVKVDEDIIKNGEGGAVTTAKEGNGDAKKVAEDFMAQMRMGKSFLHGTDRNGRPICIVRARLHKQGEQSEESLERYTVFIIETARMVLAPPVDTATIIFDMTGFTLANMDYTPVKFMIKCFEANYPESLGAVLVHNAPWVFQGIWKIIRGWLDPVVAAKVHFTNQRAGLEEFIEPSRIAKELGGDEDWEYKYVEPVPGENDRMKDTASREKLQAARQELVKSFEAATLQWIKASQGEEAKELKEKRTAIAAQLRDNYWKLDPYVRARSLYDREGIIQEGGKIDWYSTKAPTPASAGPQTSADDVD